MIASSTFTAHAWDRIHGSMFNRVLLMVAVIAVSGLQVACGGQLSEEQIQANAPRIHNEAWIVDTHLDSPLRGLRDTTWSADDKHDSGCWDIPRMIEGGADAVFLAVYIGQGPLTPEGYESAHSRAIQLFDWINDSADASSNAEFAATAANAERLHREGERAIFIGVENGYPIGTDINNLEDFYNRGMRYMTLSHGSDNQICASSTQRGEREDFGLTDYGRQVVAELNRLGVMVDCSHISDQTFFDVVEISSAPVIATHSACDGVNDHSRNFSDEMLLKLKENGGVIQLIPLDSFIRETPPNPERDRAMEALREEFGDRRSMTDEQRQAYMARLNEIRQKYPTSPATIDDYIRHVDYAVDLIGIDHIGFGSDFDGGGGVEGVMDISQLPNLTMELMRHGYSEREIKKFWGGNLLRVLKAVEAAAEK